MKRNSTTLFLESPNATTPIPWVNSAPDFSAFTAPTLSVLQGSWQAFLNSGEPLEVIPDPVPIPPQVEPDWKALISAILGGALYPLYTRLTAASFVNLATATLAEIGNANNIAVAAGKLDQSIQVTQVEGAVAASFQLLISTSDYRFTEEEKALWDSTVDSLGFSSLMYLP